MAMLTILKFTEMIMVFFSILMQDYMALLKVELPGEIVTMMVT